MRHQAQDDRFHGGYILKPNFWDVKGTHNMGPSSIVSSFQSSILTGTQFTPLYNQYK